MLISTKKTKIREQYFAIGRMSVKWQTLIILVEG
jgi:hypothetical protein